MNSIRRSRLIKLLDTIENLRVELVEIAQTEEDALNNIPANFQESAQYSRAEETASALADAANGMEEIAGYILESIR